MLSIGSKIPAFSLSDQNEVVHASSEFKGKWLVVYFYPKDDTPGCTTEACSFRDNFADLKAKHIEVIGISKDSEKSHKKFVAKYELPFLLLADPEHTTIEAFGAWGKKKFMGKSYDGILRNTYLIDPKGIVQKIYENVNPEDHAKEILKDWEVLQ